MSKLLKMFEDFEKQEAEPTPIKKVVSKPIVKPKTKIITPFEKMRRKAQIDFAIDTLRDIGVSQDDLEHVKVSFSSEWKRLKELVEFGKTHRGSTKELHKIREESREIREIIKIMPLDMKQEMLNNPLFQKRKELSKN